MNKLYYVVRLILLLLFTSIKENERYFRYEISSPNSVYFRYKKRKNISSYKKCYFYYIFANYACLNGAC